MASLVPPPVDRNCEPQLLLYCDAEASDLLEGRWRFSLQQDDGPILLDADDAERGDLNRLTLWSAVRGLEAIEGARHVTLISSNRYLIRSMTDSLPRWRTADFVWEHFGRYIEIQNADLWRRIDRALSIHTVGACLMQTRMVSPMAGQSPMGRSRIDESPWSAGPEENAGGVVDVIRRSVARSGETSSRDPVPAAIRDQDADLDEQIIVRVDNGHAGPRTSPHRSGMPRRRRGENPLRRMLAVQATHASRRFTAADLAAS